MENTPTTPTAPNNVPTNTTPDSPQGGASAERGGQTENNATSSPSQSAPAKETDKTSQTQAPKEEELIDLAVNGKTRKVTRQELIHYAQMSESATARFEEAKQMKKDNERIREIAAKDAIAALQDPALGLTKDQIREQFEAWYTREFIDPSNLSPEERKMKEYETELKRYKDEEQAKATKQREDELSTLTQRQREYLSNQIIQALDKSDLPIKDEKGNIHAMGKRLTARVAFYMQKNLENGWEAPLDLIVQQVKDENIASMQADLSSLEGKDLVKVIPEAALDRLRAHFIQEIRARRQNNITGAPQQNANGSLPNGQDKIYSSDVRKRLREMTTGRKQIT